jgi:membrane associated rhomboid family serine protease/Tfp pilus assembly protein PilF
MANCIRCGRQLPPLSFKKICPWCVQHEAAQRGEIVEDEKQPVISAPWVRRGESTITLTHVFFGANIAVYLAMSLATGSPMDFPGQLSIHFGANYGPYTLSGDWWRLITYMFLHRGLMHILFNMWCLWDLGRLCESLYGRWTYAAIYFITGIAGGLASVSWNPGVLSVGASGAIFGLAGALIASFYLGEFSLPKVAISGTLKSLVIFAVFNIVIGQVIGGVDNACHIGGLLSGLALGALIALAAPQADRPFQRASVVGVVALVLLTAGFGVRQWRGPQMRLARSFENTHGDRLAQLELIARQQPNSAQVHAALAQEYFSRQRFPEAETEFKRLLELAPKDADARFDLGMTYLSEKRLDDAKTTFEQLGTLDSGSAYSHYGLGLVSAEQTNDQAAIDEFKKAASSSTQISGIYFDMGNSFVRLKQYDSAIAAYLKEKETSGDNPDLESALADAYAAKGMTQQSQEAKNRAAQLKSGTSDPQ